MRKKTTEIAVEQIQRQIQREVVEAYMATYSPQLVRRALTHLDRATQAEKTWHAMLTRLNREAQLSRSHHLAYEMFGDVALLTHERVLQGKRKDGD